MRRFLSFLMVLLCLFARSATAGNAAPVIIRDTEIENTLKAWTTPVIKAAGLQPDAVKFVLIQDSDINAFVAGGQNVFIYTGLLEKSENPGEVVGVIAHELGHISGGHLVRTRTAMENASYESMLGALLGIGAAIATGQGGVGAAVAAGTQSTAASRFLAFSRVQESSADQAGLSFLERAQYNPKGLLTFMQKLESQELLPASQQVEYVRTHPLARDRIQALEAGYQRSAYKDRASPPQWQEQHNRMRAKLKSFISPERVAWDYGDKEVSIAAEYARTIAAYRQNRVDEAIGKINALLQKEPDNPYFLELKGQMLVDFGRVKEAIPSYRRAVELVPNAPLIRTSYAHTLIETAERNPAQIDEAIRNLERAAEDDPRSSRTFHLLATAWGRKGDESMAKLYLAEESLLRQKKDMAREQVESALPGLAKGSRAWLRAKDILAYLNQDKNGGDGK